MSATSDGILPFRGSAEKAYTRVRLYALPEQSSLATFRNPGKDEPTVTIAATSSTMANRFNGDEGRTCSKNSFSIVCFDLFSCFAIAPTKLSKPTDSVGPTRTLFAITQYPPPIPQY